MKRALRLSILLVVLCVGCDALACSFAPPEPWFDPASCFCPMDARPRDNLVVGNLVRENRRVYLEIAEILGPPPAGEVSLVAGTRIDVTLTGRERGEGRYLGWTRPGVREDIRYGEKMSPVWSFLRLRDDSTMIAAPYDPLEEACSHEVSTRDFIEFESLVAESRGNCHSLARSELGVAEAPPRPAVPQCDSGGCSVGQHGAVHVLVLGLCLACRMMRVGRLRE